MEFAGIELGKPFTVDVDGKQQRFNPFDWQIVGTGFDVEEYWHRYSILFQADKSFFIVERFQPPCSDTVFSSPIGRFMTTDEAGEWCALHDISPPSDIRSSVKKHVISPKEDPPILIAEGLYAGAEELLKRDWAMYEKRLEGMNYHEISQWVTEQAGAMRWDGISSRQVSSRIKSIAAHTNRPIPNPQKGRPRKQK